MKNKKSFPNFFLHTELSGLIVILLLLLNAITIAQETPPPGEFIIGTPIMHNLTTSPDVFNSFVATGMNTIHQRADSSTKDFLTNFNLVAYNSSDSTEYIYHYSTSYYSKWEAEKNVDANRVGMKHRDILGTVLGDTATWKNKLCWSTIGLSTPATSLMTGPHYRQEKRYKRWLYGCYNDSGCVTYTPRFQMALDNPGNANPNEDVCKIKVVFRYKDKITEDHHDITFKERTLKVGDFDTAGEFDDFYLHPNPNEGRYEYWPNFILPKNLDQMVGSEPPINYIDWEEFTGIQFCVEWLRTDSLCTLYIDYVEVYDNNGWNEFLERPIQTANKIKDYAESFKNSGWSNIKYWGGTDEPYTIDSYMPIHIVDSLIQSVQAPQLVVNFQPTWWHTLNVNGEDEMEMFYNIAKPSRITLSVNPCYEEYPVIRYQDLEWVRFNLQRTSVLDEDFWFHTQTTGYRTNYPNNPPDWCIWRKPDPPELKSMVSLALAHGAKGIIFLWFDSYSDYSSRCLGNVYKESIVDENGKRIPDSDYSLYNTIKDNLVPRLKGKLGKTLLNLDYTGNYLQYFYFTPSTPMPDPPSYDYLTLGQGEPSENMNWHCGIFTRPSYPLDNYFMLDNLITTNEEEVYVTVEPPVPGYKNYRFRNVEGVFDTTFDGYSNGITKLITHPAGEGYLYQVAPVVLFGGRLLYDEYAGEGQILTDDMIIENGKTLSISGDYYADGNIIIKNGSIVNVDNGRIQFANGKKLIIQGSATIFGTSNQKLVLDFVSPDYENGITIREGGSLTIFDCKIQNAQVGITSELNANYFNIQYVDFEDCGTHSLNIFGSGVGQLPTPPSQIKFCSITNSITGISVANTSQIIILQNTLTNTELGILLSQVTNPLIVDNIIESNLESMEGIFGSSIGGTIRGNYISGHSTGIRLGNSSPDIGANTITYCKIHAMIIAIGSNPNMVGRFAKDPNRIYPISGYNDFINNGGYSGEGDDNDGSEIYFSEANAIMREGCNSIVDDREPAGELRNTLLLMNCPENGTPIEIRAEYNYWGETRISEERFGNLIVYYEPYYTEECPVPYQNSDDEALITKTSSGEVIDTLYPANDDYYSLSVIETLYSLAGESFITGEMESAESYYNQIISSDTTIEVKKEAYCRKYEIGKILNKDVAYFSELRDLYSSLSSSTQDSLMKKIFDQLSSLCLTAQEEYLPAINEFDEIIQQNPNTENAVYAEIDALTTALLIEETDSTLHKGRLGKYLIKSSSDYNQRIDEILRKNFGGMQNDTDEEIIPTEYTLYQNFPNPFNPTTTIKYDIPFTSEVSLIIYDILGRKVKELVNTKQQAGRYEVQFDASNLSSGVYIYQLVTEKYMNSKKMILLK